jgi:2-amino-4-hydroxy-6-hydroxymethyldihydropteridine diphosphokinase
MNHIVYIALGTNLGDREENLKSARSALQPTIQISKVSSIYETAPWGVLDQPDFLNQVLIGQTKLEPIDLLSFLKELEEKLGRVPGIRFGPRLIDMDILFYDELVLENEKLVIPHPRIEERAFVLIPLVELSPELIHPKSGKLIQSLADDIQASGVKRYKSES